MVVAPGPRGASATVPAPILCDRYRAEQLNALLARLSPPSGPPSAATAGLNRPGFASEFYISNSAVRYSHIDMEREQHTERSR